MTYISILTLNLNELKFPIKRNSMANWIKKETHLIERNKHWLIVKGWKKIYQANGPKNRQE
jgi:hypothetical protein